jgi:hypothetical protein
MFKDWYMMTAEGQRGPLDLHEIVKLLSMAPDTLVRKTDEKKWVPAYSHPDLKSYFKPVKPKPLDDFEELEPQQTGKDFLGDVLVQRPSFFFPPSLEKWLVWIIIVILFLLIGRSFG